MCRARRCLNDREVHANAIIRVFCVDGPCRGVQYLDQGTGRILLEDVDWHLYLVRGEKTVDTDFGPCPAAYYERNELADVVGPTHVLD